MMVRSKAAPLTRVRLLQVHATLAVVLLVFAIPGSAQTSGIITTIAGDGSIGYSGDGGPAILASLSGVLGGIAFDSGGNLFFSDRYNNRIRRVDAATQVITTVAGNGSRAYSGDGGPATLAGLNMPHGIAFDSVGNLFIADYFNFRIRRVDAATQIITTVAGRGGWPSAGDGGPATLAMVPYPTDVALDSAGNLFIAEPNYNRIRRVDAATQIITTVAGDGNYGFGGDGGPATSAKLRDPWKIALDSAGNLFIADEGSYRIRRVDAVTQIITTVAGNGTYGLAGDGGAARSASMMALGALAFDSAGNLFLADLYRVRRIDPATQIITAYAGSGATPGFGGDGGPALSANLSHAAGLAFDSGGNLFLTDRDNRRVRRVEHQAPPPPDSDNDGLSDVDEAAYHTDPFDPDTDHDGMLDGTEIDVAQRSGCPNPLDPDSDGDLLLDGQEASGIPSTNPCSSDTDGDGIADLFDSAPTTPGTSTGALEDAMRILAEQIDALSSSYFDAPNENAAKGRRNSISSQLNNAANSISGGQVESARALLRGVLQKMDGLGNDDWLFPSVEQAVFANCIAELVILLS